VKIEYETFLRRSEGRRAQNSNDDESCSGKNRGLSEFVGGIPFLADPWGSTTGIIRGNSSTNLVNTLNISHVWPLTILSVLNGNNLIGQWIE